MRMISTATVLLDECCRHNDTCASMNSSFNIHMQLSACNNFSQLPRMDIFLFHSSAWFYTNCWSGMQKKTKKKTDVCWKVNVRLQYNNSWLMGERLAGEAID